MLLHEGWEKGMVIGRSGAGKSSLLKELLKNEPRVIMLDPLGNLKGSEWSRYAGQMGPLKKKIVGNRKRLRAVYQPKRGVNAMTALNTLSETLFDAQDGYFQEQHKSKILFVVEEATRCYPLHAENKVPWFGEICDRGRHYGIRVLMVTQSPSRLAVQYRENVDAALVLATMFESGQKAAAGLVHRNWKEVHDLPNYKYFSFQAASGLKGEGQTKKM